MDLDFGHGFVPRIGEENYKAVDRCVGPADLFSPSFDLPWAIVDGGWAEKLRVRGARAGSAVRPGPARRAVRCLRRRLRVGRRVCGVGAWVVAADHRPRRGAGMGRHEPVAVVRRVAFC